MTPTLLRPLNRQKHWTPRARKVRTWVTDGTEVCQFCQWPPERRCGYHVGGLPCTRLAGHAGDHVCCLGREHALRWRHQAKRRAAA
jgi:hypothetical protein